MSFTVAYAVFGLLMLIIIFGLTYRLKGWKSAFVITGLTFVILAILLIAAIYTILSVMPN